MARLPGRLLGSGAVRSCQCACLGRQPSAPAGRQEPRWKGWPARAGPALTRPRKDPTRTPLVDPATQHELQPGSKNSVSGLDVRAPPPGRRKPAGTVPNNSREDLSHTEREQCSQELTFSESSGVTEPRGTPAACPHRAQSSARSFPRPAQPVAVLPPTQAQPRAVQASAAALRQSQPQGSPRVPLSPAALPTHRPTTAAPWATWGAKVRTAFSPAPRSWPLPTAGPGHTRAGSSSEAVERPRSSR